MKGLVYSTQDDAARADVDIVDTGLGDFNDGQAALRDVRPLRVFARDDEGRVIGGAVGRTWGTSCELQELWVHPDHRGQGAGAELLRRFETRAAERGCTLVYLYTFTFQAPRFYAALGYRTVLETGGFTDGIFKHTMHKALDAAPGSDAITARLVDSPVARVWRAFADPVQLGEWWGPTGFRCTFQQFELRPGGDWRFVMHGPDGVDHPNHSIFRAVDDHERIVFTHESGHWFEMTITFTAMGEKTLVGWRQCFDSAEHCAEVAPLVVPANEQNLDRLSAVVAGRR